MPEGHKTHRIAIDHREAFAGDLIKVTSPQGRFRAQARRVSGRRLENVEAAGKHLFYHFEGERIVHVHLGRYGKFREQKFQKKPPTPIGAVRMRMLAPERVLDLNGPTTCRVIDAAVREDVLQKLGPDPLAGGKSSDVFEKIRQSSKPIAALLLDQSIVAGIGNIFRAEMLFSAGLDPATPGRDLSKADFNRLWKIIVRQMKVGLKYGKIITVTAKEAGMPLDRVEGNDRFHVYGNEYCRKCACEVTKEDIGGRRLYFCKGCQSPVTHQ
ncbi:MAG: DNA-formamidopyrimidine glycosylase family protein [Planctomycetota bacterium]